MSGNDTVTWHNALSFGNIIMAVLNSILSVMTVCGNAFVISVIWKREVLHVPSNILLCCLAVSDLLVGLISQPSFVIYKVTGIKESLAVYFNTAYTVSALTGYMFSGVSLLTMCAISVDRYLALKLHLRYTAVVTVPRVIAAVSSLWLFCATYVALNSLVIINRQLDMGLLVIVVVSVFVTVVAYTKVFQIVRRHQRQIHDRIELAAHFHGRSAVEVTRHKKSAVTMLYVLGAFLFCYVPLLCLIVAYAVYGFTFPIQVAYDCTTTVVYLSSSLNPPLYCWRIREIRVAAISKLTRVRNIIREKQSRWIGSSSRKK